MAVRFQRTSFASGVRRHKPEAPKEAPAVRNPDAYLAALNRRIDERQAAYDALVKRGGGNPKVMDSLQRILGKAREYAELRWWNAAYDYVRGFDDEVRWVDDFD